MKMHWLVAEAMGRKTNTIVAALVLRKRHTSTPHIVDCSSEIIIMSLIQQQDKTELENKSINAVTRSFMYYSNRL